MRQSTSITGCVRRLVGRLVGLSVTHSFDDPHNLALFFKNEPPQVFQRSSSMTKPLAKRKEHFVGDEKEDSERKEKKEKKERKCKSEFD